jgi:hypothetical protein
MDPQFQELAKHIADDVEKRFEGVIVKRLGEAEKRLGDVIDKRLSDAEKGLSDGAKMHMEELRSEIKLGAEGYGATLERIERQLTELNAKVDTKFGDHDKVLLDHATRNSALERL